MSSKGDFFYAKDAVFVNRDYSALKLYRKIKFSNKLKKIIYDSFVGKDVIELDLSECTDMDKYGLDSFFRSKLKRIVLPRNMKKINRRIMNLSVDLEEIVGEGITDIDIGAFDTCPNLCRLYLNPTLDINHVRKVLRLDSSIDSNNCQKQHFCERVGIVLSVTSKYSYIWCFSNFKYYYTEPLEHELKGEIVGFYHSFKKYVEQENEVILIRSDYDDYHAENVFSEAMLLGDDLRIKKEDYDKFYLIRHAFSRRYSKDCFKGVECKVVNLQEKYISIYKEKRKNQHKSIRDKMLEIEALVDSLNIEAVINSYKSEFTFKVLSTKIGGDDRTRSTEYTGSYYTDAYIETLLPSHYFEDESSGYGYSYDIPSKERLEVINKNNELIKSRARQNYNKLEHKKFLMDDYVKHLIEDEVNIEKYLHIQMATNFFKETRNLSGSALVNYLNSTHLDYKDSLRKKSLANSYL